jgi:hypothetical protein
LDQIAAQIKGILGNEQGLYDRWHEVAPFVLQLRQDADQFAKSAGEVLVRHENMFGQVTHAFNALDAEIKKISTAPPPQNDDKEVRDAMGRDIVELRKCVIAVRGHVENHSTKFEALHKFNFANMTRQSKTAFEVSNSCSAAMEGMQRQIAEMRGEIEVLRATVAASPQNVPLPDPQLENRLSVLEDSDRKFVDHMGQLSDFVNQEVAMWHDAQNDTQMRVQLCEDEIRKSRHQGFDFPQRNSTELVAVPVSVVSPGRPTQMRSWPATSRTPPTLPGGAGSEGDGSATEWESDPGESPERRGGVPPRGGYPRKKSGISPQRGGSPMERGGSGPPG